MLVIIGFFGGSGEGTTPIQTRVVFSEPYVTFRHLGTSLSLSQDEMMLDMLEMGP